MKLKDVIAFCDRVKPNAFTEADKTQWINDFETMTQAEELLLHPNDIVTYVWESRYNGEIEFLNERTLRMPDDFEARENGVVTISGLSSLSGNNGIFMVEQMFTEDREIVFAGTSFASGKDTGELFYDGKNADLILPDVWKKVYVAYLAAQIDLFNGEYDKYENTLAVFNSYYQDYKVWYTTHYPTVKAVE